MKTTTKKIIGYSLIGLFGYYLITQSALGQQQKSGSGGSETIIGYNPFEGLQLTGDTSGSSLTPQTQTQPIFNLNVESEKQPDLIFPTLDMKDTSITNGTLFLFPSGAIGQVTKPGTPISPIAVMSTTPEIASKSGAIPISQNLPSNINNIQTPFTPLPPQKAQIPSSLQKKINVIENVNKIFTSFDTFTSNLFKFKK